MGRKVNNDPRGAVRALTAKEQEIQELQGLLNNCRVLPELQLLAVDIINESDNEIPSYSIDGSAGVDLRAFVKETVTIKPKATALIPTGLKMDIPAGYELQIRSRSGLALNVQVIMLNAPGTVDSGYHGEIGLIVYNGGTKQFKVENGDRIAQGVFAKYETVVFNVVDKFKATSERGEGGFGSTNVK